MNVVCRGNGIDFATESTKGTKDCGNGFFFAVFVFYVAKNPFCRHFVVSDSAGVVAVDGFDPRSMLPHGGQRSGRPARNSVYPIGYRSVTLGNGNVLAGDRLFQTIQHNRGLGGAKPVKVCQSLTGQSGSRRRALAALWRAAKAGREAFGNAAAFWGAIALHCFSLPFKPFAFSLVRKSGQMTAIFSIIQHCSGEAGKGAGRLLPSPVPGFRGQISTGNIGNTVTFLAGKWRQTGNRKHLALASRCGSTL